MAYDRLIEGRKLIAHGVPDMPFRLSRRRRFIPLAFDVDGDVAATLFVRRGVSGNPSLEAWALQRREGEWAVLGGGSGDGYYELFEPRDSIEELAISCGSGWTIGNAKQVLPWPRPAGVSHATFRLPSQVTSLQISGRRVDVPDHGVAIVVWGSRRPPTLKAISKAGESLGAIPLRERRGV